MTSYSKHNLPPAQTFRPFRKITLTRMTRISGPFTVETREGPLRCEDGWLAIDSHGDPYPIAADEQAVIYEEAADVTD